MRDQYLNLLRVKLNITDRQEDIFLTIMEIAERQLSEYNLSFKDVYDCLAADNLSPTYHNLFDSISSAGIAVYSALYAEVYVMLKSNSGPHNNWSFASIKAYNKGTVILVDISPTVRFTIGPDYTHIDSDVSDPQITRHDITDLVDSFKGIQLQDLIHDPNFQFQLELCLGYNCLI